MDEPRASAPQPGPPSQAQQLLAECLELPTDAQDAAIERLCQEHPELADTLRKAYAFVREAGLVGDTELPSPEEDPSAAPSAETESVEIEGLRILERLGSGGMGDVWLAEQLEPVRRKVAVKLVQSGMGSQRILARFKIERQALARMSHPCIAQVFGAGATKTGAPYFLMEYVPGVPIHDYCDRKRLTIDERLDLFTKVCEGVQHAHQKGIIHRDLKPSNVLVIEHQGKPIPKIIDFGVAKATEEKLTDQTLHTEYGVVIGTPEYMSPEQAAGDPDDIDTRTDVYGLGVMLYEVLTGSLPFDSKGLRNRPPPEIVKMLRETLPPKPSTRISGLNGDSTKLAQQRRTTPASLARKVRGDLDWITMMAMEKERDRRYASAAGFAADIERYRKHEPVLASPPSTVYRLQKFVHRYRIQVAAGVAVFIALVGGLSVALWQAGMAKERQARFDRLAVVVRLDTADKEQKVLYPPWPEKIEALEEWLERRGRPLKTELAQVQETLKELDAIAEPQTAAERQRDRENHPRYQEYLGEQKRVRTLQHAMDVSEGKVNSEPVDVPVDAPKDSASLNRLAFPLITPVGPRSWGDEALGLALLQKAIEVAPPGFKERHTVLRNLAWALLLNGHFDDAKKAIRNALDAAPKRGREREKLERHMEFIENTIARFPQILSTAKQRLSDLKTEVSSRQSFRFHDPADGFLHATLRQVEKKLVAFLGKKGTLADVEARLSWAKRIEALTFRHPKARVTWEETRQAILKADDKVASKLYAEAPIDLKPQMGLVPIGMNPVTKLWEFYHLRSAWDPMKSTRPEDLKIPKHRKDGSLKMAGCGMVFVLVPGGTFRMGAQKSDEKAPNYDPGADEMEESPVEKVTLQPFLLSRYEMTKGQWARLTGGGDPSFYKIGTKLPGEPVPIGDAHPVESVSWEDCDELMGHHRLLLPTEAQWEYGCRAGTSTPWFTGSEPSTLAGHANILDVSAIKQIPQRRNAAGFRDRYAALAPVGTYKPNNFGLHDTHGNVTEWCRESAARYTLPVQLGNGLRQTDPSTRSRFCVVRGGSYQYGARDARSARRAYYFPSFRDNSLGLRPAREITP